MPKVDIMLAIVQAYVSVYQSDAVNKVYADLAAARQTLQWICQNQADNGDLMAREAIQWAAGLVPKPDWMIAAGL